MKLTAAAVIVGLSVASHAQEIVKPTDDEVKWLRSWIPIHCCVTTGTHGCCFKIKETDAIPMPGDNWKIRATGQILARTNWSPDGRWWRCACDRIEGKWIVHLNANTRCIFPALQSTMKR